MSFAGSCASCLLIVFLKLGHFLRLSLAVGAGPVFEDSGPLTVRKAAGLAPVRLARGCDDDLAHWVVRVVSSSLVVGALIIRFRSVWFLHLSCDLVREVGDSLSASSPSPTLSLAFPLIRLLGTAYSGVLGARD